MPYKFILFDQDGTLIDPKIGLTKSVQYALNKFGIKEDLDNLLLFIGPPINKSFQKYYNFSEEKSMLALQYYREYFTKQGMYESAVYPGIPELLKRLQDKRKKLFVATSKPTVFSEKQMKHFHLDKFFDQIVGSKMDMSDADKTTIIGNVLALHSHENKNDFVMIGDREHDIIGAKANDIDSIGVLYGYGSVEELANAKPTYITKSLTDLEKYL